MGMKLLVLSTWFPFPPDNGSRIRAYHLLRQLATRHEIRLIAGVQDDIAAEVEQGMVELQSFCKAVIPVPWQWHNAKQRGGTGIVRALLSPTPRSILETPNPVLVATIAQELQIPPDVVLVLELGMDAYLPVLPKNLPAVMDQAEVSGMERAFRQAKGIPARLRKRLTYRKNTTYWRERWKRYAAITAVSEEEARAVRQVVGGVYPSVVVIPNGVSIGDYTPRQPSAIVPGRLLYTGALTYGPNREAVRWFVRDILPLIAEQVPEAHLIVTGRHNPSEVTDLHQNPRVHLTGFLPDLRPTLAEAAICVVPLLSGGGTRLKIIEAWAAGVPVVSTTIGAAGLGATEWNTILLANSAHDFAGKVVSLLTDPATANTLATNARTYAESRFDWSMIGDRLSGLLASVTKQTDEPA